MGKYQVLTDAQVQSFLDNGYLVVKDCVPRELAESWINEGYQRLGYDPNDPDTWVKDIIWMDHRHELPIKDISPKAWGALLDVIGGEERIQDQVLY